MIAIATFALAVRVAFVLAYAPGELPLDDGFWYHTQAQLVADGHGFIDPLAYVFRGETHATAGHAPLFVIVLSGVSALGGTSLLAHQLTECVLETLAVVAIGLLGREVAGNRVGVMAATIAAVYPRLWTEEGRVLSESVYGLTIALLLLAAYRVWHRPSTGRGATLGLTAGVVALARGEALMFLPLLVLPLIVALRHIDGRQRISLLAAAGAGALVVISPWAIYNSSRFDEPVLITTGDGGVIAGANCDASYHGSGLGRWNIRCAVAPVPPGDESERSAARRRLGIDYAFDHAGRLPAVIAARVGRTWDIYQPATEGWSNATWTGWLTLGAYYVLLPFAAVGAVVLHRQRPPVFPLLVPAVAVTLSVALTWGAARFRLPAEVGFIVLAAVACDALWRRLAPERTALGTT
jgi:4-amino-4-deoxy-L-arabinose transferase-like glycosyltransferase